jgi:hypothetical protein
VYEAPTQYTTVKWLDIDMKVRMRHPLGPTNLGATIDCWNFDAMYMEVGEVLCLPSQKPKSTVGGSASRAIPPRPGSGTKEAGPLHYRVIDTHQGVEENIFITL